MYIPRHGRIDRTQVQQAVGEFQRRLEAGESNVEVVVATGVPLLWMYRRLEFINCGAIFQAKFDSSSEVDEFTTAEVIIIKYRGRVHQATVSEIIGQLGNYSITMNDSILNSGGSAELLAGEMRTPDCGLLPTGAIPRENPTMFRVIIEIEFKNRSLSAAKTFCRQYFDLIQQVQAVVLVKFFDRRIDSTFAAMAVLYRRIGDSVTVTDAVSFGTAPLARQTEQTMSGLPLRQLLVPTQAQLQPWNPWNVASNPFITIPADDIFYLSPGQMLATMPGPGVRTNLIIDLYRVVKIATLSGKW